MSLDKETSPLISKLKKLQSPPKGRRIFSWILFLSLIALFLILPMSASLLPTTVSNLLSKDSAKQIASVYGVDKANESTTASESSTQPNTALLHVTADMEDWEANRENKPTFLGLDKVWKPAQPMSSSHNFLSSDCKACHTKAFTKVQDSDCQSCHKNANQHFDHKQFSNSHNNVRCGSCHQEHQGDEGLKIQQKHFTESKCADCHQSLKADFPKTKLEDVKDFSKKHPEFNYLIAKGPEFKVLTSVRMPTQGTLSEKTNLKFPHDVHLAKKGIKSPQGTVTMKCADCHQTKADGSGFKTVNMKDHCQSCHDLRFEPMVSNREVPHGSVDQVLSTLREFYSYVQGNHVATENKPKVVGIQILKPGGQPTTSTESFMGSTGDAHSKASHAAISLFEKTTCKTCHVVTRSTAPGKPGTSGRDLPQWDIGKISPQHPWMKNNRFDHAKHQLAKCQDCHQAQTSKKAEDVLMPSIKACRTCHTGKSHESNKITSDCGTCHRYHQPAFKTEASPSPTASAPNTP